MVREAWRATVHAVAKESDTTEQPNHNKATVIKKVTPDLGMTCMGGHENEKYFKAQMYNLVDFPFLHTENISKNAPKI